MSIKQDTMLSSNVYNFNQLLIIFLIIFNLNTMSSAKLLSVDFEVFGIVQGVFFRKYTEKEALKLGLKGYCMNTSSGTVQGVMQGEGGKVSEMKNWLQYTGSPSSKITKAEFRNEKPITSFTYDSFKIKR